MHMRLSRLTGVVILIGAILGLVLSVYGLYAVWTIKPAVTRNLQDLFTLTRHGLDATDRMLVVMSTSLDQAGQDLQLMRAMLGSTADTIGQSTETIDETAAMMGETMPQFLRDTQTSLKSTQQTARLIDDILTALSNIPLIGGSLGARYRPEVPLNESVAQVNRSLEPLGQSFLRIHTDLQAASANMAAVQRQIEALARQLADIETSIDSAKKEVIQYQIIMADVRDRLERYERRIPLVLDVAFLGMTIALVWLGISQLGALLQAAELLTRRAEANPKPEITNQEGD